MSEPIVLRSEAITSVVNQINGVQDSGNEGVSETVSSLSSDVQSSATNIAGIMNDIASMKQSIALLQTNVNKLLKLAKNYCTEKQRIALLSDLEEAKQRPIFDSVKRNRLEKCIEKIKSQKWGNIC